MLKRPFSEINEIPGWFTWMDRETFHWILDWQGKRSIKGDLLEIGCYMGKSAVCMGEGLKEAERFTVIDLFENEASGKLNAREMEYSYSTLTQKRFEANYLKFHDKLPEIIRGLSSEAVNRVKPSSCRFIHIDGSHSFDQVVQDIDDSRKLAAKNAIVVCDDYRSAHTPGVAAAVWQAVSQGLKPICITPAKFYGTWGDPKPILRDLHHWLGTNEQLNEVTEEVNGYPLIRIQYAVNNSANKDREELQATKKELAKIKSSKAYRAAKKARGVYHRFLR